MTASIATTAHLCSHEDFRRVRRFGSLDALRCFSILLVIFSHTAGASMPRVDELYLGLGGVRLFFAISGFLITTLLLREREATGDISLSNFVVRRTLRIFPLYYTVLLIYIILVVLTERHHDAGRQFFRNLPFFLTYTSNWFVNNKATGGADRVLFLFAWSLATEEQFYLVWPTVEKLAGQTLATVVMGCLVLLLIAFRIGGETVGGLAAIIFGSISLSICLGVLVAHALNSAKGFNLLAKIWTPYNSLIGIVILSVLLVYSHSEILQSVASAFIVLSCVQSEKHVLARLFRWKPIVLIGSVSYGMYLMHLLCNHAVKILFAHLHRSEVGIDAWAEFVTTTAITFLVAMISFHYYESIFLKMKKRFEPSRVPTVPMEAKPLATSSEMPTREGGKA